MRVAAGALLDAWERGRDASPGERALTLLELAEAPASREAVARWTVGRRDAALLAFRSRLFGDAVSALADCPRCAETLEMEFPASGLVAPAGEEDRGVATPGWTPGPEAEAAAGTRAPAFELEADGHRLAYRLPTAGDLADLGRVDGDRAAWLLERCLVGADVGASTEPGLGADGDGSPLAVLGPGVRDALEQALARTVAERDPQADIELALDCPACGAAWQTTFDIAAFLWRELDAWAARTLRQTHLLARAYGWSERDILALSPWRRGHYLDLLGEAAP